jgi:hypothetical protein
MLIKHATLQQTGSESIRPALEAKSKLPEERTTEDSKHMKRLFSSDGTGQDAAAAGDYSTTNYWELC